MRVQRARALGLLAVLLVAGLLYAAILSQMQERRVAVQETARKAKFFGFAPNRVVAIRLRNAERRFSIERSTDGWRLLEPRGLPGDSEVINGMIRFLTGLERLKPVGEEKGGEMVSPEDLSIFELDPPRFEVALGTADDEVVLSVGKKNSFDGNAYAQRQGETGVFVVDGGVHFHLDKTELDLRDKRLVPLSVEDISGIDASGGGELPWRLVARRSSSGFETVPDQGVAKPLSTPAVDELLRRATSAQATLVLNESPTQEELAEHGLDAPSSRWRFSGGGARVDVSIRELEHPKRYLAWSSALGVVELVSPVLHRSLSVRTEQLLDRRVFPVDSVGVRRVEILSDGMRVVLDRNGAGWRVNGERPGESTRIGALIYNLLRLERAPTGVVPPDGLRFTTRVRLLTTHRTFDLQLALRSGGLSWGRAGPNEVTFAFDATELGTLSARASDYEQTGDDGR